MKVWTHFADPGSSLHEPEVLQWLAREGISHSQPSFECPFGPGLVFFSQSNPSLHERIRQLSDIGRERVLAISVPGADPLTSEAWRLLEAGASDVVDWDKLGEPEAAITARLERWRAVDDILESPLVRNNLIGRSGLWQSVLRRIVEVARFTDANVLIQGESGTGKELVARLIHTLDLRRRKGELVIVDCTTIVSELSGSEFFGHERGSFTGAVNVRDGAFRLADGGTLFLDEVSELPSPLQAQLLRVVQEHSYKRVGGNDWYRSDFRLVCATNIDLFEGVKRREFRHDLYYRIANWTFTLPPLRNRPEDVILLASHFMRECRPGEDPPELDDSVRDYLINREYGGNVRDLKQLVSRIMDRHVGRGPVTAGDVPEDERPSGDGARPVEWRNETFERAIRLAVSLGAQLKEIGRAAEDAAIQTVVREENGNLQRAARRLGVTDRALQLRRAAARQLFDKEQSPETGSSQEVA